MCYVEEKAVEAEEGVEETCAATGTYVSYYYYLYYFFVIGEVKDDSSNVDGNITLEEAEEFFNLNVEGCFRNFLL